MTGTPLENLNNHAFSMDLLDKLEEVKIFYNRVLAKEGNIFETRSISRSQWRDSSGRDSISRTKFEAHITLNIPMKTVSQVAVDYNRETWGQNSLDWQIFRRNWEEEEEAFWVGATTSNLGNSVKGFKGSNKKPIVETSRASNKHVCRWVNPWLLWMVVTFWSWNRTLYMFGL